MKVLVRIGRTAAVVTLILLAATAMYGQVGCSESAAEGGGGTFVWDMGMVYPGFPYETLFPVDNGCRIDTVATITYPNPPLPMDGLKLVDLGPYQRKKVLMTLQYPRDPVGAYPDAFCTLHAGTLIAIHKGETQSGPNFTYNCCDRKREYKILLCVYHGPAGGDSSGGKAKPAPKKGDRPPGPELLSASPCEHYWNTGIFIPSQDVKTPDYCLAYIRQMAHQLFDEFLKANRAANPQQWAWVPTGAAIDSLSISEIMSLRQKIVADLLKSGA